MTTKIWIFFRSYRVEGFVQRLRDVRQAAKAPVPEGHAVEAVHFRELVTAQVVAAAPSSVVAAAAAPSVVAVPREGVGVGVAGAVADLREAAHADAAGGAVPLRSRRLEQRERHDQMGARSVDAAPALVVQQSTRCETLRVCACVCVVVVVVVVVVVCLFGVVWSCFELFGVGRGVGKFGVFLIHSQCVEGDKARKQERNGGAYARHLW